MGGRLFIVPRRKGTSKPSSFFALRALTTKPRLEAIRRLSSRKKVIEDRLSNTLSLVSAGRNDGGCLVRILARSIRKRISLRFLRGPAAANRCPYRSAFRRRAHEAPHVRGRRARFRRAIWSDRLQIARETGRITGLIRGILGFASDPSVKVHVTEEKHHGQSNRTKTEPARDLAGASQREVGHDESSQLVRQFL